MRDASRPWITPDLKCAVKLKRDLYSIYRKYPTSENFIAFKGEVKVALHLSGTFQRVKNRILDFDPIFASRPSG